MLYLPPYIHFLRQWYHCEERKEHKLAPHHGTQRNDPLVFVWSIDWLCISFCLRFYAQQLENKYIPYDTVQQCRRSNADQPQTDRLLSVVGRWIEFNGFVRHHIFHGTLNRKSQQHTDHLCHHQQAERVHVPYHPSAGWRSALFANEITNMPIKRRYCCESTVLNHFDIKASS